MKVVRADRRVELQDIDAAFGSSNVKGRVDVRDEGSKSAWTINLASSALNVADLPGTHPATPAAKPAVPAGSPRFVFSEAATSFDALRAHNATGEVTIGRLTLADGRTLDRVHARFTLRDGRLVAPTVQASVYGGTISGALTVDATRGRIPALALRVEGRELDLAALFAAAGVTREVRGGKTDVAIDVTMHGDSPRQWTSGISGSVRAVVGPARSSTPSSIRRRRSTSWPRPSIRFARSIPPPSSSVRSYGCRWRAGSRKSTARLPWRPRRSKRP